MTKHQKIDLLPNIDRRSFLVGTAATGLVFGYVALPEIKNALAAPAANFEPSVWYAIGRDGKRLYVADSEAHRIRLLTLK